MIHLAPPQYVRSNRSQRDLAIITIADRQIRLGMRLIRRHYRILELQNKPQALYMTI
jgi:hypothetical protein